MAVSILGALTIKEEPDFFTETTLPVCWVLVPFSKCFYIEHLTGLTRRLWDLGKKDPWKVRTVFLYSIFTLVSKHGR